MRFVRSSNLEWYDFVIVGLSAMVVYPDAIVEWWSGRTGRPWGWRHVILFELAAIILMVGAALILVPLYPKLDWWKPLAAVGAVIVFRFVLWIVVRMFGFD